MCFQPISVIAPFTQGNRAQSFTSSAKSVPPPPQKLLPPSLIALNTQNSQSKIIKRNQSFHGFRQNPAPLPPYFPITGTVHPSYLKSYPTQNFTKFYNNSRLPGNYLPNFFSQLPPTFGQTSGFNTISGLSLQNKHNDQKVESFRNINKGPFRAGDLNRFTNPIVSQPNRISGRKEEQFDIRRTASGINVQENNNTKSTSQNHIVARKSYHNQNKKLTEKRFGSLDVRKQKCYSPTFYSVRCKKHPKRRSVIFALSNNCFSDVPESNNKSDAATQDKKGCESLPNRDTNIKQESTNKSDNNDKGRFQNLTDSIQIFEQSLENSDKGTGETPIPAPRSKKQKKSEIVYANVSPGLQSTNSNDSNSSTEPSESNKHEMSITEVQIHASNDADNSESVKKSTDAIDGINTVNDGKSNSAVANINESYEENINENIITTAENAKETNSTTKFINKSEELPKLIALSPKQNPSKPIISPHALKNSPILKVSPNFIKPKTESPKGALSQQIQAKIKSPPVQSPADNPNKTIIADSKDDDKANEPFPEIPQMPILNTQIKWSPNIANLNNQVCLNFLLLYFPMGSKIKITVREPIILLLSMYCIQKKSQ